MMYVVVCQSFIAHVKVDTGWKLGSECIYITLLRDFITNPIYLRGTAYVIGCLIDRLLIWKEKEKRKVVFILSSLRSQGDFSQKSHLIFFQLSGTTRPFTDRRSRLVSPLAVFCVLFPCPYGFRVWAVATGGFLGSGLIVAARQPVGSGATSRGRRYFWLQWSTLFRAALVTVFSLPKQDMQP